MSEVCTTTGEMKNAYILVGIPEGKRPLGKSRSRWEENIVIDLTDIGWEGVDCTQLAQWRDLLNTVMNYQVA
jgi:hypothetical protein